VKKVMGPEALMRQKIKQVRKGALLKDGGR
jgi:hypothetical protein